MSELSYALANTSITPTTIARVIAFNSQLAHNLPLNEQLELLSHIRAFIAEISWAEAELYASGMDRLVTKVSEMEEKLLVLKAHILYDFAQSFNKHYGNSEISLAHCLLVTTVGNSMPALTEAILGTSRLEVTTKVLVPTKPQLWGYFYHGAVFCSVHKKFDPALSYAVASLALSSRGSSRDSALLVTALSLIVNGEPWPLKFGFEESDARICLKIVLSWFETLSAKSEMWSKERIQTTVVPSLEAEGLGYLAPHLVTSFRLHRLRALHRTIKRTAWSRLEETGHESLDTLIEAGYRAQVYMQPNMTIIESPDYDTPLEELYDLLEQVLQVSKQIGEGK